MIHMRSDPVPFDARHLGRTGRFSLPRPHGVVASLRRDLLQPVHLFIAKALPGTIINSQSGPRWSMYSIVIAYARMVL